MRVLLILFFLSLTSLKGLNAQVIELNLQIEVTVQLNELDNTLNILVKADSDNSPFTFLVYDVAPWKGGVVIESSEPTNQNQYMFTGLKQANYMVCAMDKNQVISCENIQNKEK